MQTERRWFRDAVVLGVPTYWLLFYVAHIQAVQPWGQGWLFRAASGALLLIPLAVALSTVFVVVSLFRKRFRDALLGVAVILLSIGAVRAFKDIEWFFRRRAVMRVVDHLAVLPQAIRRHAATEGRPPASLDQLVPRYLPAVPATGLGAYADFEYRVGASAPAGEEWALLIPTSQGILNWDLLLYLPSGQYPTHGWGGSLERFGEWAYVHE